MKLKRAVGRFFGRKPGDSEESAHENAPIASPELRADAAKILREHAEHNDPLFNRASRFEEKAERLNEGDGATSESALRVAERARAEILAGLSALRESFAASNGEEGRLAFDVELRAAYPQFAPPTER